MQFPTSFYLQIKLFVFVLGLFFTAIERDAVVNSSDATFSLKPITKFAQRLSSSTVVASNYAIIRVRKNR